MPNNNMEEMTASVSDLGWTLGQFPDTFTTGAGSMLPDAHQWTKKESTVAESGEIQCVSYQDQNGEWLIVVNE